MTTKYRKRFLWAWCFPSQCRYCIGSRLRMCSMWMYVREFTGGVWWLEDRGKFIVYSKVGDEYPRKKELNPPWFACHKASKMTLPIFLSLSELHGIEMKEIGSVVSQHYSKPAIELSIPSVPDCRREVTAWWSWSSGNVQLQKQSDGVWLWNEAV